MEKTLKINCPECGHEFHAEDSLKKHLLDEKLSIRKEFESEFNQKEEKLKKFQDQLLNQQKEIDKQVRQKVQEKQVELQKEIKEKMTEEYKLQLESLNLELKEKQTKLIELKDKEIQIERLNRKLIDVEKEVELKFEKQLSESQKEIELKARKQADEASELKLKEKEKMLDDYKKQVEEMKRKIEQGSMQLQGEVQELEIQNILSANFSMDVIEEVGKGVNGADVLHRVCNRNGVICGTIAFESKRTKNFSDKWIEKLKDDMRVSKADIGIIVTETLPKDIDGFGLKEGIYICTFREFLGLAKVLRESILHIHDVKNQQEAKGDKMNLMYNYLTSNEFRNHMEAIVRGFSNMKDGLEKEKKLFKKVWAERDKELELIIDGATNMYGSIRAIAGNSVKQIEELELPLLDE